MSRQIVVRANFLIAIGLLVIGKLTAMDPGTLFVALLVLMLATPFVLWVLSMQGHRLDHFLQLYFFDYNHKVEPLVIFQVLTLVAALIPGDWSYLIPLGFFLFTELQKDKRYKSKLKLPVKTVTTPFEERDKFKGFPFLEEEIMLRKIPSGNMKSIMIIRGGEIGDVLFTTPVIRTLREKFPDSKISYITRVSEALIGNKYLDQIWDFKDPISWYVPLLESNWVLDFRGVIESNLHGKDKKTVMTCLAAVLRAPFKGQEMDYFLTFEERNWRKEYTTLSKLSHHKTITLGAEAGSPTRCWPEAYLIELANLLAEKEYQVILLGTKAELSAKRRVLDLRGKTTFRQAAALISASRLYVGVDSGLLYTAIAQRIPAIGIFSVLPPKLMPVNYEEVRTLSPEGVDCAPCYDEFNICQAEDKMKCLKSITPERVLAAILEGSANWEIKSLS